MGYTDSAPIEYAEFVLSREMGWSDIDAVPSERVDQAFTFFGLEQKYAKIRAKERAVNGH